MNPLDKIVGQTESILEIKRLIEAVSRTDSTVLLQGESGTGKEVVAQTIHALSKRNLNKFVPVNCGAIPSELLESELFGHEKGAFTGAFSKRMGRFELAEQGTLFLDEIGDMPLAMQVKILRALQEKKFERVGGSISYDSDTRIIAATHRTLKERIKTGEFREDLFYRLNVFPIEIPSLRDRQEDIPLIIKSLSESINGDSSILSRLTPCALESLSLYSWPGNIRELKNIIERICILHPTGSIYRDNLPVYISGGEKEPIIDFEYELEDLDGKPPLNSLKSLNELSVDNAQIDNSPHEDEVDEFSRAISEVDFDNDFSLKEVLKAVEIGIIKKALNETGNHISNAAMILRTNRTTLSEKIKKYQISTNRFNR